MSQAESLPLESPSSPFLLWRKSSLVGRLVGFIADWRSGSYLLNYADAIATFLICAVITVAPFTSTALMGVILLASAGFWLMLTLAEVNSNQITGIHLWVFAYWLVSVVATAFSPLKADALSGLIKFTLYLIFFGLCARVLGHSKLLSWITAILLLVSLTVSAYGIRQEIIGVKPLATWTDPTSPLAQDTRVYSYLGNPNLLAGYLLPAMAFSLAALILWQTLPQKILAGVMVLVNAGCIYFTDSRGGWIALVVLAGVFLLGLNFWWAEYLPPFWRKWLVPIVVISFAILLGIAILVLEPLRIRILSIFSWRSDSSNNFRINVWLAAWKMFKDYPLIGIGPGNEVFNQIYPLYMQTKFTALSAYSIFIEITLETGLIGIACFLGLIIATIQRGIKQIIQFKAIKNQRGIWLIAALAAIAGLATQGLVDTVWYRPQINTLWWLLVGLVASFPVIMSSSQPANR
jgi:putative inorganic carbon (HCO3(-)) transporter